MEALYFAGDGAARTIDLYNKWAKGKHMARDVIVHSHTVLNPNTGYGTLIIVVFFDEGLHPEWVGKNDTEN